MHLQVVFFYNEQRHSSSFYKDQRSVQINGSYSNEHFSQTDYYREPNKQRLPFKDFLSWRLNYSSFHAWLDQACHKAWVSLLLHLLNLKSKHLRKKRIFLRSRVETKMPFLSRKMRNLVDFYDISKLVQVFRENAKKLKFSLQPCLDLAFVSLVIIFSDWIRIQNSFLSAWVFPPHH